MKKSSNYSYDTSLPAFHENEAVNKQKQCDELYALVKHLGHSCLRQLSDVSGIEHSTVSARLGDFKKEVPQRIDYLGKVVYKNRLRKKIVIIKPPTPVIGIQSKLF